MIQVYDYQNKERLSFHNLDDLCDTLNLNRKNVIGAISRESRVLRRYLVTYGKLSDDLIRDKDHRKEYKFFDLYTNEERKFEVFNDLVRYANNLIGAEYPQSTYHRNMARGYNSYNRFKVTKG